jgi:hypothetical protein
MDEPFYAIKLSHWVDFDKTHALYWRKGLGHT